MVDQALQIFGAICLLAAFAAAQFRLLDQRSYLYLALNAVGSGLLAYLAYALGQWGFFLLEGIWSLVSFWGVIHRIWRGASPPAP